MQNVWSLVAAVCTTRFNIKKIYILIRHFPEERAIVFIYNINWVLFITEADGIYSEVRFEPWNITQDSVSL